MAYAVLHSKPRWRECTFGLLFAVQADGGELLTVEGLAKDGQMHPLQQSFWDNHALQLVSAPPVS